MLVKKQDNRPKKTLQKQVIKQTKNVCFFQRCVWKKSKQIVATKSNHARIKVEALKIAMERVERVYLLHCPAKGLMRRMRLDKRRKQEQKEKKISAPIKLLPSSRFHIKWFWWMMLRNLGACVLRFTPWECHQCDGFEECRQCRPGWVTFCRQMRQSWVEACRVKLTAWIRWD